MNKRKNRNRLGLNLVAVDASSQNLSLAVMDRGELKVNFNRRIKFGASELVPFLEKELKRVSFNLKKADAFIVGAGPGSFTGLRISFSAIKAFSLSLNKPVIKLNSFFALAYPFKDKHEKIAVISDARRNLVYGVEFISKNGVLRKKGKERLTGLETFCKPRQDCFFVTYDEHIREKVLSLYPKISFYPKNVWPKACLLLEEAGDYYLKKKFTPLDRLEPLYLHPGTCQIRKRITNDENRTTKNV